MDVIKCEPDPYEVSSLTCSQNETWQTDVTKSEVPVLMGVSIMKTENEVILDFIKSEPNSHGEKYLMSSHGKNEMIVVKEEEDTVTFQAMKAKHEIMKMDGELEGASVVQADITGECKCFATSAEVCCPREFLCSSVMCVCILQQLSLKQSGCWNLNFSLTPIYSGSSLIGLSHVWTTKRSMKICQ